ncbi:hypothetical protein HJC23_004439 [Cyclotella cryptica]|uniref:Uncharacterized protein n=1 Tax=Cyclotella cryptica TaxID=29204 RepID=A0ABD3QFL3_9STRA|eukprot:CCRYP_006045-RA/>CCRYP_006045-RA protein AED:0.18 eAED:0.18 QI:0/-1/0/1/-1/1/1/0/177
MAMLCHSPPNNSLANDFDGPIVTFRAQRRTRRTKTTAKSVSFSPTSQMAVFKCPTHSENEMKWYNKDDYEYFRSVRRTDIINCSNMMTKKVGSGEPFTVDDISSCTGLEFLLSRDVPRLIQEIKMMRDMHIRVILEEQERQVYTKTYDIEFLARLSEISSRSATERAHKLACSAICS